MASLGSYEIVKQIGEGGFGRVFLAKHKELGEYACLKQNIHASAEDVELLRNEAKVLWKLNEYHSIPHAKDFILLDKNNAVLVMDYIKGKTLEDLVEDKGALHAEDACWITERLLGALQYCHYKGVVHSDVKPGNVFVEADKHDIKLIDFGLAANRPKAGTAPTGYTPKFTAPELIDGKPPIPETDLYGAGIVLLYALGGDVDSKSFPADTPTEIAEFGDRLLRYDPAQRPSWERENLAQTLSDIRFKVFGRRHCSG